ncbi:MAG TPA: TlpA disulfide reductase family protein [Puia sp.]|nr:TlpA disulfide reductase family protein [Puia sp.]
MLLLLVLSCSNLLVSAQGSDFLRHDLLRNGTWRALLHRKDGHDIAFNFDVKDSAGKKIVYIRNADERLLVDDIRMQGDSVLIRLPFFESQFRTVLTKDGHLEGIWLKRLADHYQSVPFTAYYNETFRFSPGKAPVANVSGRWAASFRAAGDKEPSLRVGEFEQKGARVTGTFLDPTGDYRYLEGIVDGDSLRLSCFDGGHAYSFTARIEKDNTLSGGQYFAGAVALENWTAVKDAGAKLPDDFTLTKWKKDSARLDFTFLDLDGKKVSIHDERFKNKVVLIQIMGSWCPNCMDETRFLSGFYDQYRNKGVEIIALAYERSTDFARSQTSLRSFQQRFQVKYPVLITGVTVSDPRRAEKTLPQLEEIVGFPTTIFTDRQGKIQKIHTGFNGPGTGEHYEEQQKEFYATVDGLLGE